MVQYKSTQGEYKRLYLFLGESKMNILQQINEEFPFEVRKMSLYGPDGMTTHHKGLFRCNDNGIMDCVGSAVRKNYVPHTNDDIAVLVEAAMGAFDDDVSLKCHWDNRGRQSVIVAPSKKYRLENFGGMFPRVYISAGFDGNSFSGSLAQYVDICKNLMIPRVKGESIVTKIRHTRNLRPKISELVKQFRELVNSWNTVGETVAKLDSVETDILGFIRGVFPLQEGASQRETTIATNRTDAIIARAMRESNVLGRPSGRYTVMQSLNAVQGFIQHERTRKGNPTMIDRAVNALSSPDVSRAMDLALELAS